MNNEQQVSMGAIIGSTRRVILRDLSVAFIENDIPINMEQYLFLHMLNSRNGEEVTQQDMANLTCKDKSSILRTIDVLEKKELVIRRGNTSDRRKNILILTKKCNNLFSEISQLENQLMETLKKGISEEDYSVMVKVMYQIQNNAANKI